MTWVKALLTALCAVLATSAQAETWRHAPSGISLDIPADLRLGEVRDLKNDGTDVFVQLGSGRVTVTFFVYRAAYPNAALWYDRARRALDYNFGLSAAASPRQFTLRGASSPSGLREELDLPRGRTPQAAALAGARSTGVAVAAHGEWLIKVRITTANLDRTQVSRMMDSILSGVRIESGARAALPLTLPGPCPSSLSFRGRSLSGSSAGGAGVGAALQGVEAAVRGRSGLAAEPAAWCRFQTALPQSTISVFARRDGGGWVALLGDAGAAMTALRGDGGTTGQVAVYGSSTSGNQLLFNYDGVPDPAPAVERGVRATMAIGTSGT